MIQARGEAQCVPACPASAETSAGDRSMTQAVQRQGLLVTPSPAAPQAGYIGTGKNELSHADIAIHC